MNNKTKKSNINSLRKIAVYAFLILIMVIPVGAKATANSTPTMHWNIKAGDTKIYKVVKTLYSYGMDSAFLLNNTLLTINVTKITLTSEPLYSGDYYFYSVNLTHINMLSTDNTTYFISDYNPRDYIPFIYFAGEEYTSLRGANITTNGNIETLKYNSRVNFASQIITNTIIAKYDMNTGWAQYYSYTHAVNNKTTEEVVVEPLSSNNGLFNTGLPGMTIYSFIPTLVIIGLVSSYAKRYRKKQ